MLHDTSPITPEWRPYSAPTALNKIADPRGAVASNAVLALRHYVESHAVAIILKMHKGHFTACKRFGIF